MSDIEHVDGALGPAGPETDRPSARRAWLVLVLLTPFGLVLGFLAGYAVAPYGWTPESLTTAERWRVYGISALVAAAAPIAAFVLALKPARAGRRSGIAALVVSALVTILILWASLSDVGS